jgi:uncharacterized protein (TIGR00255 family)
MKSMTGYGAVEKRSSHAEISVIVKSVNGRFLEPRFHLPKEYFFLESQLKREIGDLFSRGTVDVFIYRRGSADLKVKFNKKNASRWVDAHRELARALQVAFNSDKLLERLSSLPQVFELRESSEPLPDEKRVVLQAFRAALKRCYQERGREGRSLQNHVLSLLRQLQALVARIEKLREQIQQDLEVRLRERLERAKKDVVVDPARFAQELVFYLDKSDVTEEIVRLKEHLQMCAKHVKTVGTHGKKLDFYGQELLREVNTIGSKANHAQLTELVIEAKGLIEAFKEQVQNIE